MTLRDTFWLTIGMSFGTSAMSIIWLSTNRHNTVTIKADQPCLAAMSLDFRTTGANSGDTYTVIVNGDTLETNVFRGEEWLTRRSK